MNCRFCKTPLKHVFIDLQHAPPSNSFLTASQLMEPETYYPLKVFTCHQCFLVQVDEYKKSDAIFDSEYVYFSSYSSSWLAHSKKYTEEMKERFLLDDNNLVVEIASNDGYLLQYFKEKGIPVLGIEPTKNTAEVAIKKGIPTVTEFMGVKLAKQLVFEGKKADLLLGNNVLAHVPDINDFVCGMKILLNDTGIITMEFPHLMQLIDHNQFDTIYHEHFSYLSLFTAKQIFEAQELIIFDVEEISTHGGSLRIFAKHQKNEMQVITDRVQVLLDKENSKGINQLAYYQEFENRVQEVKLNLLEFLTKQKRAGKKVAAYGAAAKGNTLLNYCGIKSDLINFVVDANPAKQDKFLPGSHIPVKDEQYLKDSQPDYIIILPWNIHLEIKKQLSYINNWGGEFILPLNNS